jgi:hypothetical protein
MPETTLYQTSDFPKTSNFRKTSDFHKTSDFRQTFSSFSLAHPGVCRISIFEPVHLRLRLFPVIVASQLPESIAGIANFIDDIAGETLRSRQGCPRSRTNLLLSEVSDDPLLGPVLIQHYPENLELHRPDEHFSVVTFQMKPDGTLDRPIWERVSRSFVEDILLKTKLT